MPSCRDIKKWEKLVGASYESIGQCFGLANTIYQEDLGRDLPTEPLEWRKMFKDIGWPVIVEPYDILFMNTDEGNLHMAVALSQDEMIHAREDCRSVVQEPIIRYAERIRTIARLRNAD